MPTITDEAVCIRNWDFSETSQTTSLFTRNHGIVRGLAKGSRRDRSSFSGGIDLVTRGQLVASIKPGRELATIMEWNLHETWPRTRTDPGSNKAAYYIIDLLGRIFTNEDPHERSYFATIDALRALQDSHWPEFVLLRFQWTILVDAGFKPDLDEPDPDNLPPTLAFSPSQGRVLQDNGSHDRWRVRRSTITMLRDLQDTPELLRPEQDSPESPIVQRCNRLLAAYVRELIGREPPTMSRVFPEISRLKSVSDSRLVEQAAPNSR